MSSFHEPPHGEEEKGDRHQEEGAAAQLAPLSLENVLLSPGAKSAIPDFGRRYPEALQPSPDREAGYLRPRAKQKNRPKQTQK